MAKFTKLNIGDIVASGSGRAWKKLSANIEGYLTFSSPNAFNLTTVDNAKYWDGIIEYSTDTIVWDEWNGTNAVNSTNDGNLYIRGIGNTYITGTSASSSAGAWRLDGTNISVSGNIENLLDYATVASGEHPKMGEGAFKTLFAYPASSQNVNITDISNLILPATTLADDCYRGMFYGCSSLKTAPELPATTLATECYRNMFNGCTSLKTAPELPATTLATGCYRGMFYGCSSLKTAPELPATTLADNCYYAMFLSCSSLITTPELPATTLADNCYRGMFEECSSLITTPELPATTLATGCYRNMFYGCSSLKTAPELPATTLADDCYRGMFLSCSSLKLSTKQTGDYTIAYRIPTSGTGTTATDALTDMFLNTGGTFTGTPEINTTYYLHSSNSVV